MFALRLNWWYIFFRFGTESNLTQFSCPVQPPVLVPLTSPVHWQRENLESQANILIFHTPTQWCGTCFDTSQSKALPSTASKPHGRNKEHSGGLRELLSDGNKKWGKRENKSSKIFYFCWSHQSGENEGSQRDQHQLNVIPWETFLFLSFIM